MLGGGRAERWGAAWPEEEQKYTEEHYHMKTLRYDVFIIPFDVIFIWMSTSIKCDYPLSNIITCEITFVFYKYTNIHAKTWWEERLPLCPWSPQNTRRHLLRQSWHTGWVKADHSFPEHNQDQNCTWHMSLGCQTATAHFCCSPRRRMGVCDLSCLHPFL